MGHLKLIMSLGMIALFTIAIITFAMKFADDNNSDISLAQDSDYNNYVTNTEGNLTEFSNDVDTSAEAFTTSTIKSGDEATVTGGQFKAGLGTNMNLAKNSFKTGFQKIFGSDSDFGFFFNTVIAILLAVVIAYGYYAWKGGSPD